MAEALGTPPLGVMRSANSYTGDPGNGWILADGRSYPRTGALGGYDDGYDRLFNAICPIVGQATTANASPNIALANHCLDVGGKVVFTNLGASGFSADPTIYYVRTVVDENTFTVTLTAPVAAQSRAAFVAASANVNATGVVTAALTVRTVPWGINAPGTSTPSVTHFQVPDSRGRIPMGRDRMGSVGAAGRVPNSLLAAGSWEAGEERHLLLAAENGDPGHNHGGATAGHQNTAANPATTSGTAPGTSGNANAGGGHGHNAGNYTSNNASADHIHGAPMAQTTPGSGNSINFFEPWNFAATYTGMQGLSSNHAHWAGSGTGLRNSDHSHLIPTSQWGGKSVSSGYGPLAITAEAAQSATTPHRNMPPFLAASQIVRIY